MRFCSTIKELQQDLGDTSIVLNAFVLSVTPYKASGWWEKLYTEAQLAERNVLFMADDAGRTVGTMIERAVASAPPLTL